MELIREWVAELGGFARKRDLVARGARDHHLTDAVRTGEVLRARNGWYSTADPSDPAFRAVRVGGRLAAGSALWAAGAWMKGAPRNLHVSIPDNASRQRSQWDRRIRLARGRTLGVVLHWEAADVTTRGTRTSVAITDALLGYIVDAPLEEAIAALDWALAVGRLDRIAFEQLILRLPRRLRGIADWVDDRCGSYPESLTRTRLRLEGFGIRSQVQVGQLESIDLLVENIVAVEVDGRQHHADRFEKDRGKDLTITLDNKHSFRITPGTLEHRWDDIERGMRMCLIARGCAPPPPQRSVAGPDLPTSQLGRRGSPRLPMVAPLAFA